MSLEHSASTFADFSISGLNFTTQGVPQALQSLELSMKQNIATQLTTRFVHIVDPYNGSSNLGSTSLLFATEMIRGLNIGQNQGFKFRYGYSWPNGSGGTEVDTSPWYELIITDLKFNMDSRLNGIAYTLTGMSVMVADTIDPTLGYSWATDSEHLLGDQPFALGGRSEDMGRVIKRIKMVIRYIIEKKHGYKLQWIHEPDTLIDASGNVMEVDDAFNLLSQTMTEEGIADITYVKSTLLKYLQKQVVSSDGGLVYLSSYTISFDDAIDNTGLGRTVTIQPSASYIVSGDGVVTEVTTQVNTFQETGLHFYWQGGYLENSMGLGDYGGNNILSCSLEFNPMAVNAALIGEAVSTSGETVSSGTGVRVGGYSSLDYLAYSQTMDSAEYIGRFPIKGTITIPGYTQPIALFSIITVHLFIGNQEFPTSGKYLVLGKTDTIQNGVFTTTLELIKAADISNTLVGDYSPFNALPGVGVPAVAGNPPPKPKPTRFLGGPLGAKNRTDSIN